ncbi:hypothetical protein LCM20_10395 [Halobacillus litoralis]|uniref:hypothetical protein n=1 Tax=Halobacillus litoralis TaxID=45668 RepID=UPI001CD40646|nr:hypothetical protein [Halobacillus litoralis]MCA0971001.1 hypothetical protein [Halobacillus litoralis]
MSQPLSVIGLVMFFIGIGLYVLEALWFLHFLVPFFSIGGIVLIVVAMFLSFREEK